MPEKYLTGNAVMIPHYGLTGAAIAILLTIAVWSVALCYLLARATGLRSHFDPRIEWLGLGPAASRCAG